MRRPLKAGFVLLWVFSAIVYVPALSAEDTQALLLLAKNGTALAQIVVAKRDGVAMIPEEAVLQRADGAVVFRALPENRVERRLIEVGVHHDGMVEVVKGVVPGDLVVLRGQAGLSDGERVSPRNPDGSEAGTATPDVAGAPGGGR